MHFLLLHYHLLTVSHVFLLFLTLDHNPTLGSHTSRLVGSLQPSIHEHLLAAANIVANVFHSWLLHFLLLHYHLFIVSHVFLLSCTLDCNPMLGSHTGGLVGSLQPSIHEHLSSASNMVAKCFQGWLLHFLLLPYHLFIISHVFLLFSTLDLNPTLGSHTSGLVVAKTNYHHQPTQKVVVLGMYVFYTL